MPAHTVMTVLGREIAPGDAVRYGNRQAVVTRYFDGNAVISHWDTTQERVAFLNDEPVTVERLVYQPGVYEPPTTWRERLTILALHAMGGWEEAGFRELPESTDTAVRLTASHVTTCQAPTCPVCVLDTHGCTECDGSAEEIAMDDSEAHGLAVRPDGTVVVLVGCEGYAHPVVSAAWTVLAH